MRWTCHIYTPSNLPFGLFCMVTGCYFINFFRTNHLVFFVLQFSYLVLFQFGVELLVDLAQLQPKCCQGCLLYLSHQFELHCQVNQVLNQM